MNKSDDAVRKATQWDKQADLHYFESMQNSILPDSPCHTAKDWDRRAKDWAKDFNDRSKEKSKGRIASTIEYLSERGILQEDYDVIDIGCGPGRFTAEFAKHVNYAVGIDISEKMLQIGESYLKEEMIHNAALRVCDFQEVDIEREQMKGAFDLVFSSITPAINGMKALEKSMEMSRKYCFNITHICKENKLQSKIMKDVFNRKSDVSKEGYWFYSLFNTLFLKGYYPETSYYLQHKENRLTPDEECAVRFMNQLLPAQEQTIKNAKRIEEWLHANVDDNGQVLDGGDTWYGRILWDTRMKTKR